MGAEYRWEDPCVPFDGTKVELQHKPGPTRSLFQFYQWLFKQNASMWLEVVQKCSQKRKEIMRAVLRSPSRAFLWTSCFTVHLSVYLSNIQSSYHHVSFNLINPGFRHRLVQFTSNHHVRRNICREAQHRNPSRFSDGGLNELSYFAAGLQGVVFCEDMAHVLHTSLCALRHKTKHTAGSSNKQEVRQTWSKVAVCQSSQTMWAPRLPCSKAGTSPPPTREKLKCNTVFFFWCPNLICKGTHSRLSGSCPL